MPSNDNYNPQRPPRPKRRSRTLSTVSIPPTDKESKLALLKCVLPLEPHSTAHHATVGAFTLTGCARTSLRCFSTWRPPLPAELYERDIYRDPATRLRMPEDSPPSSPACSFASIPSISRTASPFSGSEGEHAAITPRGDVKEKRAQLHAGLDALERDSRVGTGRVVCATCMKQGTNFPRCKRCAQMWCSRECRVASHRCAALRGEQIKN
ncbi:hypothetical protein B0H13DRAFT_2403343 [Mycena leptocephala]|nr:hypothetical protein B0H13DRAFT_2403343 [Mycena leptocephala]